MLCHVALTISYIANKPIAHHTMGSPVEISFVLSKVRPTSKCMMEHHKKWTE